MSQINLDNIIKRFEKSQAKANEANEARYAELLQVLQNLQTQVQDTYGEAFTNLENIGGSARMRVQQNLIRNLADTEQDLISRGLGNTTIRASARRGAQSDAELYQQQIDEMVAGRRSGLLQSRAGAEMQMGDMLAGAIERRSDVGPDTSLYTNLLNLAAASRTDPLKVGVGRGTPPSFSGGGGDSTSNLLRQSGGGPGSSSFGSGGGGSYMAGGGPQTIYGDGSQVSWGDPQGGRGVRTITNPNAQTASSTSSVALATHLMNKPEPEPEIAAAVNPASSSKPGDSSGFVAHLLRKYSGA